jgi:hypothetical protein
MVKEQKEGKPVEAKIWKNQNEKRQENSTDRRKRKIVPIGTMVRRDTSSSSHHHHHLSTF